MGAGLPILGWWLIAVAAGAPEFDGARRFVVDPAAVVAEVPSGQPGVPTVGEAPAEPAWALTEAALARSVAPIWVVVGPEDAGAVARQWAPAFDGRRGTVVAWEPGSGRISIEVGRLFAVDYGLPEGGLAPLLAPVGDDAAMAARVGELEALLVRTMGPEGVARVQAKQAQVKAVGRDIRRRSFQAADRAEAQGVMVDWFPVVASIGGAVALLALFGRWWRSSAPLRVAMAEHAAEVELWQDQIAALRADLGAGRAADPVAEAELARGLAALERELAARRAPPRERVVEAWGRAIEAFGAPIAVSWREGEEAVVLSPESLKAALRARLQATPDP